MDISVIIPAHNEEKGIGSVIDGVRAVLDSNKFSYEIIVVNDGSTDNTANIALGKGVCLINHEFNHGYGASIKAGVNQSKGSIIVITDADGTYPVSVIPDILKDIKNYDMVVGARTGKDVNIPLIRRPAKWVLAQLANYLSDSKIVDLNSGLRAMKKDVFLRFNKILPDGFSLTTTVTLAMLTNGYQVKYIPINYGRRIGKSKIRPIRDTLNFLLLIIRTSLLFNPLKIFLPVSLMLCLSGIFIFFYSVFFLPHLLDLTALLLFTCGIQLLAIGMIADLINRRVN